MSSTYEIVDNINWQKKPNMTTLDTRGSTEAIMASHFEETLVHATNEGRVTTGVYECAKLLDCNPDGVMLCIIPDDACCDITMQIHFTLLEAFCWECDIRLLKVDSMNKLSGLMSSINNNGMKSCQCAVIELSDEVTDNEKNLLHCIDSGLLEGHGILRLPES